MRDEHIRSQILAFYIEIEFLSKKVLSSHKDHH